MKNLQQDHTSTGDDGGDDVRTELEASAAEDGDAGGAHAVSSALGAGGATRAAGARGTRGAGSDAASAISTRLRHQSSASASGLGGGLGGGSAAEVAGTGTVALADLLLVVAVKDERQLLLGVAHAVRAVATGRSVGGDTGANTVAADGAEQRTVVAGVDRVLDHAGQRAGHAGAEFLVGSRGQASSGQPVGSNSRASAGRVGGSVRSTVDTSGANSGHLLREVLEVRECAHGVARDADQTCGSKR